MQLLITSAQTEGASIRVTKADDVEKRRRQKKTIDRARAEEAAIEEEGPTYGSGEFGVESDIED